MHVYLPVYKAAMRDFFENGACPDCDWALSFDLDSLIDFDQLRSQWLRNFYLERGFTGMPVKGVPGHLGFWKKFTLGKQRYSYKDAILSASRRAYAVTGYLMLWSRSAFALLHSNRDSDIDGDGTRDSIFDTCSYHFSDKWKQTSHDWWLAACATAVGGVSV